MATADTVLLGPPRFSAFLLKVASRCNISCDYCYVYEHSDQSWRRQPRFMSEETERRLVERLVEYTATQEGRKFLVAFHGGEPLLAGAGRIAHMARRIREQLPDRSVDFSLQTNGTLLDAGGLDLLEAAGVGVSLSLDGPRAVNDVHRRTALDGSTFDSVMTALDLLRSRPGVFTGVIGVIDPASYPTDVLRFFHDLAVPALDLLLPDAHHLRPPLGRDADRQLYERWLVEAFDVWFDRYSTMRLRTFDALLAAVAGVHGGGTDAFGLGDVSLLCIETDGSYHDLDVLKITEEGRTSLGASVHNMSIQDVARSSALAAHRRLLTLEGLAASCRQCPVVQVCGGGAVAHRYSATGFDNPTVYCGEMLALITHVKSRLSAALTVERERRAERSARDVIDLPAFESAATAKALVAELMGTWQTAATQEVDVLLTRMAADASLNHDTRAQAAALLRLSSQVKADVATRPCVVLWTRVGTDQAKPLRDLAGNSVMFDPDYVHDIAALAGTVRQAALSLHRDDFWLRAPFGPPIVFLDQNEVGDGRAIARDALRLITDFDGALAVEIDQLSPEIQFVRDESAHPDKMVSFSDDSVPGALYVGLGGAVGRVDVHDLAESIIHEHRHQKLYLLSRSVDLVVRERPLVPSPWREELRPPSGLLHAVWVFVELCRFWRYLEATTDAAVADKARRLRTTAEGRLRTAWETLSTVDLTPAGHELVELLMDRAQ